MDLKATWEMSAKWGVRDISGQPFYRLKGPDSAASLDAEDNTNRRARVSGVILSMTPDRLRRGPVLSANFPFLL